MRYSKTLSFPNGITVAQAAELQPGQYIRLFNSPRVSRVVGVKPNGSVIALHSCRSGKTLKNVRGRGKSWLRILGARLEAY